MSRIPKPFKKESVSVEFVVEKLQSVVGIEIVRTNTVDTESRLVSESSLHRPGLALAGFLELFTFQRIQILGNTEHRYLDLLSKEKRLEAFNNLLQFDIPCFFLTEANVLDAVLVEKAREIAEAESAR